ncbi:unnamed protein product [Adineta ricciae]|uniref:G-protein coupled receptors family 1 profile domain-containing protein n=1 Tax=Adineta ricciae TaxID=249248 RepID=A0A815KS02_ADIRI|nr:unnamed protein product [Adineta ricciae]
MLAQHTLTLVTQQIYAYVGLPIMVLGVVGNVFNIIIFTTLKTFRETTCALYLTAASVANIAGLLIALFVRILRAGFLININGTPWICKIQIYIVTWCLLVSLTAVCLASIDQCLSMSKYRRFSHLRFARYNISIIWVLWALYSIPILIYWDAPYGACVIINASFEIYTTRFQFPILLGVLPISTMSIFSLLAFYNARTLASRQIYIVRQSHDRQLTAMTLIHVVYVIITTVPYVIYVISSLNQATKNPEQVAVNNLIYGILVLIDYSSFASPFYLYVCVSQRFRNQFFLVLSTVFNEFRVNKLMNNQITPTVEAMNIDQFS